MHFFQQYLHSCANIWIALLYHQTLNNDMPIVDFKSSVVLSDVIATELSELPIV